MDRQSQRYKYSVLFLGCLFAFFAPLVATAQASGTTEAVGFLRITIHGKNATSSGDNFVAPSFVGLSEFVGIASAGAQAAFTIQVPGAAWDEGQFDLLVDFSSHYVEVLRSENPSAIGLYSDILSHGPDTLTIADDFSATLVGGEEIAIRKHHTLSSLFGKSNEAGFGTGNSDSADTISVLFSGPSPKYETFYYLIDDNLEEGWRSTDDPFIDRGDWPIPRNAGLRIRRHLESDLDVLLAGAVAIGPGIIPIKEGLNIIDPLLGIKDASDSLPSFTLGGMKTDSNIPSGLDLTLSDGINTSADLISIHNGAFSFDTYYKKAGTSGIGGDGWRLTNDPFTPQEERSINAGDALLIKNKGSKKLWIRPQLFPIEEAQ